MTNKTDTHTDKTLAKTVDLMVNGDHKDRMVAEYKQLTARLNRLRKHIKNMVPKTKNDVADLYLAKSQVKFMQGYLDVLKERASIEGVDLK